MASKFVLLLIFSWIQVQEALGESDPCSDGTYNEGDLFLYETGCYPYYYECVHEQILQRPCSSGTIFDTSLGICNHPRDVPGCGGTIEGDPCSDGSYSEGTLFLFVDGCFPYYYECVHGAALQRSCAPGTVFDTSVGVCNHPENVASCPRQNGCHGHSHGDLYLPEEGCVPYFYQCVHGSGIKMDCPSELVFDTTLNVCNWPSDVGACDGGTEDCDGHYHGDLYVPDDGCYTYFYQCAHGEKVQMNCPEGLVFDQTLHVCNWPSHVAGCEGTDSCHGHSHGDLYVPDDGCYPHFFQCVHGKAVKMDCPQGLVFDPALKVCNWPAQVAGCGTDSEGCHGHSHGDLYIPDDGCYSYFYQCVHGTAVKMDCPDGLVFDATVSVCNWPSQVTACKGSTTTSAMTKKSTTTTTSKPTTTKSTTTTSKPTTTSTSTATTTTTRRTTATERPPGKEYVGFVVDDTGSMSNEIGAIKDWLMDCIEQSDLLCGRTPDGGWIIASFNDPDAKLEVGPTTNISEAIAAVEGLKAHGGWDCPEMSMAGLKKAAEAVPDDNRGCKIFFFSDAVPKDMDMNLEVRKLFLKKGCAFVPVLTACCGPCHWPCLSASPDYCINHVVERTHSLKRRRRDATEEDPKETVYYKLAEETGGNIYIIDKPKSTKELSGFLEVSATLGFCDSTELAGPLGQEYKCQVDCLAKSMCWDGAVNKCFCNGKCSREHIPKGFSKCGKDENMFCSPKIPRDFFADPKSCVSYYTCSFGRLNHHECPSGKVYSPLISSHCDFPANVPGPCGRGRKSRMANWLQ